MQCLIHQSGLVESISLYSAPMKLYSSRFFVLFKNLLSSTLPVSSYQFVLLQVSLFIPSFTSSHPTEMDPRDRVRNGEKANLLVLASLVLEAPHRFVLPNE